MRTLAFDAPAQQARLALTPFLDDQAVVLDDWQGGVLVIDPRPGVRLYALPLLDGVIARWDLLLEAHRQRGWLALAGEALAAMGHPPGPDTQRLAGWVAGGATESEPPAGPTYVPRPRPPVTDAEWFGIERRAQLVARLLPITHNLNPGDPFGLALYIASRLIEPTPPTSR